MTSTQTQPTTTLPAPGTYTVDPVHSTVGFVVRHLVASKVRGSFTEFEGSIVVGATPEASSVTATVKAASIVTNQAQRDEHLRSSDFLEAATHPELTLRSKRVAPGATVTSTSSRTSRSTASPRRSPSTSSSSASGPGMAPNSTVVGFEATASIDRRDFDVSFNGTLENGSFVVSNKVELELAIEASAPGLSPVPVRRRRPGTPPAAVVGHVPAAAVRYALVMADDGRAASPSRRSASSARSWRSRASGGSRCRPRRRRDDGPSRVVRRRRALPPSWGSTTSIAPVTLAVASSSIAVGPPFTTTTAAPLDRASGTRPAIGHTDSVEPTASSTSHREAAASARCEVAPRRATGRTRSRRT